MSRIRARFAPSPTGLLHLGGLRTALYNHLLARSCNGQFILRIEDTDQSRYVPGAVADIVGCLNWAGLKYDEGPDRPNPKYGPFFQSQCLDLYRKVANNLLLSGHAYKCFCTPEELARANSALKRSGKPSGYSGKCRHLSQKQIDNQSELPFVLRFKTPLEGHTVFTDAILRDVRVEHKVLDDFVILKADGWPTYHLASVVDDHRMDISHVLRGQEWMPSTPKHMLMYQALQWQPPVWVHLPLLLNSARKKLSKRDEFGQDALISTLRSQGYIPEALLNFVALLGWSPKDNQEKFTLDELVGQFSLKRLHAAPAVVDFKRLDGWQSYHFTRQISEAPATFVTQLESHLAGMNISVGNFPESYTRAVLSLISTRLHTIPAIVEKAPYFWMDPTHTRADLDALQGPEAIARIALDTIRSSSQMFTIADYMSLITAVAEKSSFSKSLVQVALRYFATGTRTGATLPETLQVLGAETITRRLENVLKILASEQ